MLSTDTFTRLCRARDLLRHAADRPLTLEEVAREAAMSHFHFIRQFTALFGITPHQYRIQTRIDRARYRLAMGDESVTDLCMALGASSLGSFSAQFAQRAGMPPSQYRQRARAMIVVPGMPPPALFPGCPNLMAAAFATLEKRSPAPSRTLDS
jgi:AraC-like DNA-binding protein